MIDSLIRSSAARAMLAVLTILLLGGCSRMRFIVEAVPSSDELTETVVLGKDSGWKRAKVALIDVSGMIMDAEKPGLLFSTENPVARFSESLKKAADDSAVKAVIIRINSPGGTVTASDIMFKDVEHFKETTSKPVVILMGDVAASGGYYLACAGDEIIAHSTTITGSIGVLIQTFNFADGMGRIGIHADAITSGPNKKMGSPFEPMPDEHRELLQGIVDEFYQGFRSVVAETRETISPNDMDWITDGRVLTGARAAELGVIDQVGDLRTAFESAKTRADVAQAVLVKYHRPLEHVGSAYAQAPTPPADSTEINLVQVNMPSRAQLPPGFYYVCDLYLR